MIQYDIYILSSYLSINFINISKYIYCLLLDNKAIAWNGFISKFLHNDIIKNSKAVSHFSYDVLIYNFVISTYSVRGFLLLNISWTILLLIWLILLSFPFFEFELLSFFLFVFIDISFLFDVNKLISCQVN